MERFITVGYDEVQVGDRERRAIGRLNHLPPRTEALLTIAADPRRLGAELGVSGGAAYLESAEVVVT